MTGMIDGLNMDDHPLNGRMITTIFSLQSSESLLVLFSQTELTE